MKKPRQKTLHGAAVSGGIAIGRAVCITTDDDEVLRFQLEEADVADEVARFEAARESAIGELAKAERKLGRRVGKDLAAILGAQGMLLADRSFSARIIGRIVGERVNAEWAVARVCEELEERFAEIEGEYLRERGEDLRNIASYLVRALQGIAHHEIADVEGDVILVARELTPSDALRFARERVVGFALEAGGRTSHTTIILRGLNLPAVSGLEGITERVTDQDSLILDGEEGRVVLHPGPRVCQRFRARQQAMREEDAALAAETRALVPLEVEGQEVELHANLELVDEVEAALRFGCAGIGLYRSEFFFLEKSPRAPTEEEHYRLYCRLVEAMGERPVVVRTFDLPLAQLSRTEGDEAEENPVLGIRGIRLMQARPDLLRAQVRALHRAAVKGDLRIMIPLVTSVDEVRRFRGLCRSVLAELRRERKAHRADVPIGAMIEVPAAALVVDHLARELDFVSIGTNDLIQYALAVDRNNEGVAELYEPTHPAVLRLLADVVERAAEVPACEMAICGEMACDPLLLPFLLGIGLRRFSMGPRALPLVRERIRSLGKADLRKTVSACLAAATGSEVRTTLERLHPQKQGPVKAKTGRK